MKKYGKNGYFRGGIISFLMIIFCSSSVITTHQTHFSFDTLFPATWYQKGLESALSVWQTLANSFEKNHEIAVSFDFLLARLAFTQFCINRMKQEGVVCLTEDIDYFLLVLNKVQSLIDLITVTDGNEDFVLCVHEMILNIQQQLSSL